MSTINQKREYISKLYPGLSWAQRVSQMPEDQVVAIYFKAIESNQVPVSEKEKSSGFTQGTLF